MTDRRDFTDRFLKSIKPAEAGKRIVVYDGVVPGFGIRISDKSAEKNRGSFVLVARYPGSSNPTARRIGDYPAMPLAKARDIAREWREHLRQGVDPKHAEEKRQQEEARRKADTFRRSYEIFAEDHLSTLRTGDAVHATIKKKVYPSLGDRSLSEIKRGDIIELIRTERRTAPIAANRLLAYLKKFFGWAVDQDLIEASPAASVKRPAKESKRDRVLTEMEIRAIWQACEEHGAFGRAFRMMLLTGQRRSEVGGMKWIEIDAEGALWRLSRERVKSDRAHEIPLSRSALEILIASPRIGDFVFCTGRSANSLNGSGATEISGWAKAKARLDAASRIDGKPLDDWHLHDLRRTCATYLAKLGTDRVTIGKILNHSEGSVTAIYDRFTYEKEKREALELWADHLAEIVRSAPVTTAVKLHAVAA